MGLDAGTKIKVRDTLRNKAKNGLVPGKTGYITFADKDAISVVIHQNGSEIRLKVARGDFGGNFEPEPLPMPVATAYIGDSHAKKPYA
ncbi:hypothetical protein [Methylobrevis albus]|uniref:Uncharacterized protein n=1 Tax=Methylobrevis albus TaxID=2793297 RepID=A0A931N0X5_9HYPH|nr:hypothetical protein [Methylobrevis albus]MBH0239694.1 hypothetical protein [Methylobrevis albus]